MFSQAGNKRHMYSISVHNSVPLKAHVHLGTSSVGSVSSPELPQALGNTWRSTCARGNRPWDLPTRCKTDVGQAVQTWDGFMPVDLCSTSFYIAPKHMCLRGCPPTAAVPIFAISALWPQDLACNTVGLLVSWFTSAFTSCQKNPTSTFSPSRFRPSD